MQSPPPNHATRLVVMILAPGLACLWLVGALWGGSNLPETSRQLFGTVLAGDLIRPAIYGLALRGY